MYCIVPCVFCELALRGIVLLDVVVGGGVLGFGFFSVEKLGFLGGGLLDRGLGMCGFWVVRRVAGNGS